MMGIVQAATRLPFTLITSVAVAGVLAVAVANGGFDLYDVSGDVVDLEAGTAFDTGPFDVTVERVVVLDELPGVSEDDDATRVVALISTVTVNGDRTLAGAMLRESVALKGIEGVRVGAFDDPDATAPAEESTMAPQVFVVADGTTLDALQPGLEYEAALVWEQSTQAAEPTEVEVTLASRTWRESSIDHSMEWLDPAPAARGEVPVTEDEPAAGEEAGG